MSEFGIQNEKELVEVLMRSGVAFAALFGSRARGTSSEDSDYDILIDFLPNAQVGLIKFQEIEEDLSAVVGAKVDLVTVGGVDRRIKDEVLNTMKVIYDHRSER